MCAENRRRKRLTYLCSGFGFDDHTKYPGLHGFYVMICKTARIQGLCDHRVEDLGFAEAWEAPRNDSPGLMMHVKLPEICWTQITGTVGKCHDADRLEMSDFV